MSHFSVMVIGPDVAKQLQPYHEFECTGKVDEYVKEVDITAEARENYDGDTSTRLQAPDGSLHSYFDDKGNWRPEFSQPDPGAVEWDKNRRKGLVPEGYKEVKIPTSTVKSFADYVEGYYGIKPVPLGQGLDIYGEHKYGFTVLDKDGGVVKVIDRTNPNKEWDWWVEGGRWSGFLKLKSGTVADSAIKSEIDFDRMRDEAGQRSAAEWDKSHEAAGGQAWESFEAVRARHGESTDAARTEYRAQPAVAGMRSAGIHPFDLDDYLAPKEVYTQEARDRALSTYAVLKDGQWYAKGKMGWWGASNDKISQEEWNKKVSEMLDGLPDDARVTIVDCHI